MEFFETSAKENVNVKAVFERLVDIICDKMSESLDSDPTLVNSQAKGTRLTENPNPQKVFNYWIQHTETTRNTEVLKGVLDYLADKKTKLIMYTYDSFLLDFDMNEGVKVLKGVQKVLEKGNYPTKVMVGKDYSEEVNITNKLTT